MAVDESLDLFVSDRAWQQWERLHKEALQSTQEMAELSETARNAFTDLGGTQTLAALINVTAKATQANKDMADVTIKLNEAYDNFGKVIGMSTGNMAANIQQLIEGKNALKGTQDAIDALNKKLKDGELTQDAFYKKMIPLTEQLQEAKISVNEYTAAVNNEIKATSLAQSATQKLTAETITNKIAVAGNNAELKRQIQLQQAVPGSIAEARLQSAMWRKELVNLNLTTTEGIAKQKKLIEMIAERDSYIKSNVDAYTAQKINIGNYPDATAQLTALNTEMEALVASGQADSEAFTMLAGKANEIKLAMGGVSGELAMVTKQLQMMAAEGKQNEEEFTALTERAFELKAAVKEVQSIINNGTTSIPFVNTTVTAQLALVKNQMKELAVAGKADTEEFMALQAEAQRLTVALKEVSTAINGATTLGSKFGSIVERMGLRMIANLAIFQVAISIFQYLQEKFTAASKALDEYNKALKEADDNVYANSLAEQEKAAVLLAIARNTSQAMNIRVEAVKKLQSEYPNYLGNLSEEAILTGNITKEVKELNEALYNKALMEANEEKVKLAAKRYSDAQDDVDKAQNKIEDANSRFGQYNNGSTNQYAVNARVRAAQDEANAQRELAEAMKKRAEAQSEINKYNGLAQQFGIKAAGLIVGNGDKVGKEKHDYTLKNEQNLTKELYAEYAKRMEYDAMTQKAIVDDETSTYQERIEAFKKYNQLMMQSKSAIISANYDNAQEALQGVQKAENKPKRDRTAQDKALIASKKALLQKLNNLYQEGVNILLEYAEKEKEGVLKIQDEEVTLRLSQTKRIDDSVNNMEGAVLADLKEKYESGAINYEKYIARKEKAEHTFQMTRLQMTKAYLEEEIKTLEVIEKLTSTVIDKSKIQEQLDKINNSIAKQPSTKKPDDGTVGGIFGALPKKKDEDGNLLNILGLDEENMAKAKAASDGALQIIDSITKAMNTRYQQEIDNLERKKELIDQAYQADINAVQGSMASEQKKAAAIRVLNAQKQASDLAIHNQEIALKRKMAKDDKVANIASIIEKTAVAVMTMMSAGPVVGQILAAVAAVTGAIELGIAVSAPLPQYRYGTKNQPGGVHPGGLAILGDAYKKELVIEPGKAPYMSADTPTVYDLAAHTRVIPQEDLIAGSMGFMTSSLLSNLNVVNQNENTRLEDAMKQTADRIENAIKNKREVHFHQNNGEYIKSVKNGSSWVTYLNKNF